MILSNIRLADIFHEMSLFYKYQGNKDRFRSLSYERAAKVIENNEEDIYLLISKNKKIKGIGKSIAEKIIEFNNTGSIKKLEELKSICPLELIDLLNVRGFGPVALKILHEQLGINTKEQLKALLESDKLKSIKGLGIKKIEIIKEGLKLYQLFENRMLLWDALKIAESVINWVKKCKWVNQVECAGSLRRKKETIGDIDLVVSCNPKNVLEVANHLTDLQFVSSVISKGSERISIINKEWNKQIDFLLVPEEEWGSALQHFTGSKEHNVLLRTKAQKNNLKLSEHGILNLKSNQLVKFKSEIELYNYLGYEFIPPEIRENKGELELSENHKLPNLITLSDLKGDLHVHSLWSDGRNSISEMVEFVRKHFNYEYIAITDHSKSSKIARGITEKQLEKQIKEIKLINKMLGIQFVKTGIEVDILSDGKLDFSDELLSQLDWVTASIHSGFKNDNTERIIAACNNKHVDCIGHPTGRLIGKRNSYKINFKEIIKVAKLTGTAFEINAQPYRMDLNEGFARIAKENHIPLVISADAHHVNEFDFMKLGIAVARRAWCEKIDILNTFSWEQIVKWKSKRVGEKKRKMETIN
jgi:DNA polymerase (family 10)